MRAWQVEEVVVLPRVRFLFYEAELGGSMAPHVDLSKRLEVRPINSHMPHRPPARPAPGREGRSCRL
eukprot:COSAG01_NODE_14579_length_1436_cov_1.131638_2_plen_67_part_00